jgi:hypothetical protein
MSRRTLPLLPMLLALAFCAPPPPPVPMASAPGDVGQARADAATLTACRSHADEVYNRQRRDTIYTINNRNSPFSGNDSTTGIADRGLSERYGRENMIRDCVRNTGAETDRTATAKPAAPARPAASAPTVPGAGTALPPPRP